MFYKVNLVNAIGNMLTKVSPKNPCGDPIKLSNTEIEEIANRVGDWYIRTVDVFLRANWGAKPKLGTRSFLGDRLGIQDKRSHPWCDDWATDLLASSDSFLGEKVKVGDCEMPLNQLIKFERVQWHGGSRMFPLQHNYILVRPWGHEVANPPSSDPDIVLLDPWINIRPDVYTTNNHPYPGANTGIK